ncbi:PIN domain-containing protein [Deinococcus sp. SM5_A1]|uniref:PIN domain-containing protein n=1 Tax=Deinococcus sp. SM5_A1 TaxID=3379094 RepID=UPI00385E63FC
MDTDVWSEGLRKRSGEPSPEAALLTELIRESRVQMLGCIRQEALQGCRDRAQFDRLRAALAAFPERPPMQAEHELAAEFFNLCRSHGIQGSSTDYLICACSVTWGLPILTKDRDFARYAAYIPLTLVQV